MDTRTTTTMPDAAGALRLQRLFQLASPSLPVGAFAYSEGLETAVETGGLRRAADVDDWLRAVMAECMARIDLPVFLRLYDAWAADDFDGVRGWSRYALAVRETAERRAQEIHLGTAMAGLLDNMGVAGAANWRIGRAYVDDVSFGAMFALAAWRWNVGAREAATALGWAWLENQVLAAVKLVPLGQTDGQQLLFALAETVPAALDVAAGLDDAELGGSLPGVTLMCTGHETLYSRLYRS